MTTRCSGAAGDEALVARVREGCMDALGALYLRYGGDAFAAAYRVTGGRNEAEDVVHDVFVGLPQALRSFERGRPLGPWLRRMAMRTALMHQRTGERRLRREGRFQEEVSSDRTAPRDPGTRIDLQALLSRLPVEDRQILRLRTGEGLSHAEIGEILGITEGAAAVRFHRALKRLRSLVHLDQELSS